MQKKINKGWKVGLALVVMLTSVFQLSSAVQAEEIQFSMDTEIEYTDDNSMASIIFDVVNVDPTYQIESISGPDGLALDLTNTQYIVLTNDTYLFTIVYYDRNDLETPLTCQKEVEVSGIKKGVTKEVEEETTPVVKPEPQTITNPAGDSLTVKFLRDSGGDVDWTDTSIINWNYSAVEKMEVTATFGGKGTTKDRYIDIDVPDGYTILGYSAKTGTTAQAGETILTTTDIVQQGMISSTLTSQNGGAFGSEVVPGFNNTNNTPYTLAKKSGKIRYVFNSETETVVLTFQLGIDYQLYNYSDGMPMYSDPLATISAGTGTGQVLDALKVTQTSGTNTLEETIATNVTGKIVNLYTHSNGTDATTYIDDDNYSPDILAASHYLYISNNSIPVNLLAEEIVMTYSYPEGAEFVGLQVPGTATPTNVSCVDDPITRTVTVRYENVSVRGNTKLEAPLFRLSGDIFGTESGKLKTATFQTTQAVKLLTSENYLTYKPGHVVTIVDKDLPLKVEGFNQEVYDYTAHGYTEGYQFLGNYNVSNPSFVNREDVPLLWEFDEELGIRIARMALPASSTISNLKLYTTKNPTGISLPDMKSSNTGYGTNAIIDADKLGLDDDEYITKIEGMVDVYPAQVAVEQTSWAGTISGYCAYGNIQNGIGGSHTLTVDGVSATSTITTTEERVIPNQTVASNTLASSYYPGEDIPVHATFTAGPGSYNRGKVATDNFLQDPNVYIRVPKGFTLDETSVAFTFKEDVTDKATLQSKSIASDGATIYKYVFNDPHTILAGYQTKGDTGSYIVNPALVVDFNLKVAPSNQGTAGIPLRDIIMVEGKGKFVGYDSAREYLREDDFGLTDSGFNLMVPSATPKITVIKLPELQVFSGIRVKNSGDAFSTYDGSDSSIAGISRTKNAEIEMSYFNNAPNAFDQTNIYFPIPKAGEDYGKYFNNKALSDPLNTPSSSPFTWDANLTGEITVPGFTTYYATDGDVNSVDNDGTLTWEAFVPSSGWKTYSEVSSSLEDVVFLKFVSNAPITSGATGSFTFDLAVDSNSPVDVVNYWRTYSTSQAESATAQSGVLGSVLAASVSVGEISGQVFYDNNANGIYDTGDTLYTGSNLAINLTEKDGKITTTSLPIDGTGKFSIEQLKEGEYSLSAINSDTTNYHFAKTTTSVGSVIGSNPTPNASHSEGTMNGLVIEAITSEVYDTIGIGLVSKIDTTYMFEDRVKNDTNLSGKAKITMGSTTMEYDGSILNSTFPAETFGVNPTVTLPSGMIHLGWQLYYDNGGTLTKMGDIISASSLSTTTVPTAPSGQKLVVKAVVSYGPTITANTITKYVGDTVDLLEGVSAVSENNVPMMLSLLAVKNTEVTHSMPITDGKYTTAGTYEVTIQVTDLSTGSSSIVKRIVKVNEAPTVTATPQKYTVGDSNILTSVTNNPTASWKKASDTVGTAPTNEVIVPTTITNSVSGPSNDFSVEGIYEVTYTATNPDGKVGTKTVEVLIVDSNSVSDSSGDITIDAEGFSIPNAQAAGLTETLAKDSTHGNSSAYYTERDSSDVVTGYTDISSQVTVNTTELTAIQGAPTTGGIYPLTYTVTEDGKTVSKTVTVVVEGTRTPPPEETTTGDSLTITGKDYTLTNVNAKALTSNDSITLGTVKAMLVQAGTNVTNITVNATELAAIKATGATGGSYPLTYTATHTDGTNISVTLTVTVLGSVVAPVITTVDEAYYVGDSVNLLEGVSAKEYDNVTMTLEEGSNVTITSTIPTLAGKYTTPGTYEVTYVVEDSRGITATDTKIIKVHGLPVVSATPQKYTVGDSTIVTSVTNNPSASYLQAGATVGSVPTATPITGITNTIINGPSSDYSVAGIYEVTYTATNIDVKVGTKTVEVLIVDSTSVSDSSGDITIDAEGFSIPNAQAAGLTESLAKDSSHGNSSAYYTERDSSDVVTGYTDISSQVTVNTTELTAIQGAPTTGGIYPLTYTVTEDGKTVSKTVTVVVEGTRTPPPEETTTGDSLTITGVDYTISNVDATDITSSEAITLGLVQAKLVEAGTNVTNITVNATELAAIKAVGANGGSYPLTYTAIHTDGTSISVTLTVTVLGSIVPPVITTVDQVYYVGDTVNLLEGVSAKEYDNVTMTLEEGSNVTITSTIPTLAGTYTTPGTYEVTYVVEDSRGITATDTKIIKVHGLPVVEATPQKYTVGDSTIVTSVTNNPTASYLQAGDVVGSTPTATPITGITNTIISGPSSDFSVTGIYEVTYTATNPDGKVGAKTVEVLLVDSTSVSDSSGDVTIGAIGFTVENAEAEELTEMLAKDSSHGNSNAYFSERDTEEVITGFEDITGNIIVDEEELEAIQEASVTGGIYPLTYTVIEDGKRVSKTVSVIVKGTQTVSDDTIALSADGFSVAYAEASSLDEAKAILEGKAEAMVVTTGEEITSITVNEYELEVIQEAGENGGIYDLTYTATYDDGEGNVSEVSVTVKVVVIGIGTPEPKPIEDDALMITANGFILENSEAVSLDSSLANDYGEVEAWLMKAQIEVTDITVNEEQLQAIQEAPVTGGIYDLTFSATSNGTTISTTVKVLVKPITYTEDSGQNVIIDATGYMLEYAEAITLEVTQAKDKGQSMAYGITYDTDDKVIGIAEITKDITVEETELTTINETLITGGIYDLTYRIDDGTNSAATTVKVLVKPKYYTNDTDDTDANILLGASGFTLENSEASNFDETKALLNTTGNLSAFFVTYEDGFVIGYTDITTKVTVNAEEIQHIKQAPTTGGIYDLTYMVTETIEGEEITVTKTVKVVVLGTNVPPIVSVGDDSLAITAYDFTIPYSEANALDDSKGIDLAKAQAWLIKADIPVELQVDKEQLATIQKASIDGGVYDLTFTATYIGDEGKIYTITTSIKVTVLPGEKPNIDAEPNSNVTNTSDSTEIQMFVYGMVVTMLGLLFSSKRRKEKQVD